jgi:hypothetical protein
MRWPLALSVPIMFLAGFSCSTSELPHRATTIHYTVTVPNTVTDDYGHTGTWVTTTAISR